MMRKKAALTNGSKLEIIFFSERPRQSQDYYKSNRSGFAQQYSFNGEAGNNDIFIKKNFASIIIIFNKFTDFYETFKIFKINKNNELIKQV